MSGIANHCDCQHKTGDLINWTLVQKETPMERLPDLLRSIRADLQDAIDQAQQEAIDAGAEDTPYWDITNDLQDSWDFVDGVLGRIPGEN